MLRSLFHCRMLFALLWMTAYMVMSAPVELLAQSTSDSQTRQRSERGAQRISQLRAQSASGRSRLVAGMQVDRDLVYETVNGRDLHLDLYLPPSNEKLPLVIWVHGGGWKSGSKNGAGPSLELLKRGYAVASVEYRLSGEAIFPAAISDCKAAVSFLRLHAGRYQLDPKRFGAWGSSAGGHLVSLMGTTGDDTSFNLHPVSKKVSSEVQAVCNWFGPSDFLRMNDAPGAIDHDSPDSPESRFIGGPIQQNPELVKRANPITYITEKDPPFLHLHGSSDRLVLLSQSELLHAALTDLNVQSELHVVVDGGHGFRGSREPMQAIVGRSMDFFDAILRPQNEAK